VVVRLDGRWVKSNGHAARARTHAHLGGWVVNLLVCTCLYLWAFISGSVSTDLCGGSAGSRRCKIGRRPVDGLDVDGKASTVAKSDPRFVNSTGRSSSIGIISARTVQVPGILVCRF
jgi:hypothetical protein